MHTTIDIDAYRNQLLEDIRTEDNLEVLERVRQAYTRAIHQVKKQKLPPYTMEELHLRIVEAEKEIANGELLSVEEADEELKRALPWLR